MRQLETRHIYSLLQREPVCGTMAVVGVGLPPHQIRGPSVLVTLAAFLVSGGLTLTEQ